MGKKIFRVVMLIATLITGCNSEKKSEEIANYKYNEGSSGAVSARAMQLGDFVKKDSVCYGLILVTKGKDQAPIYGKTVKAKVVDFNKDGIKMKSLENITFYPYKDCLYFQLAKGQTWIENENELFRTREEAIEYLKKNHLDDESKLNEIIYGKRD